VVTCSDSYLNFSKKKKKKKKDSYLNKQNFTPARELLLDLRTRLANWACKYQHGRQKLLALISFCIVRYLQS